MDLETVKSKLHAMNFRLTQERELVLRVFMESGEMFTAMQLYDRVKEQYNKVGLTTVYRLFEVLTKLRLVTPFLIDGEIYYTFCSGGHHHHFVCLDCHRVKNIYGCEMDTRDFSEIGKIEYHRMDLFGHCENCQGSVPSC